MTARLAALSAAALVGAAAAPALADTLVDNVDGITLDAHGAAERFTGIVIGADGRIAQVLHRGEPRPTRPDYAVDLHGAVVMPGLIDAHAHVIALGLAALTLDLTPAHSLAEAQGRIAAYAAARPGQPWIIGRGWDSQAWGADKLPTAADLDAAVADRPVWLVSADGHAGWANTRALALAGITAATREPAGGKVERTAGSARPGGVLTEGAMELMDKAVPPPRPEDRDLALQTAQAILLEAGITTVTDMGTPIEDWQAFRRAGDAGVLSIRIACYAGGVDNMALIGGPGPSPWLYEDRLRLNGVDLPLDGALAWRGSLLKGAYADAPGSHGPARLTDTQLKNLMSRGAIDHFQVAVEASGDGAVAEVLDAISALGDTYTGERRWRIEQGDVIDPADMPRLGRAGVAATLIPARQPAQRTLAEARLGPARLAGAWAARSVATSGAVLAFGSDAPAQAPKPFAAMADAITRQGADNQPFGGWQPQEALPREAALAGWTTGAAWAGMADGRLGRIAVGERADFVVIDRDPLLASPGDLRGTQVLQSWVGGRLVYSAKPEAPRGDNPAGR